jgi:integrase-like protein
MATHPDYPRVSSKIVKGKTYWRFMDGKRPYLPGVPHSPEFDAAYQALIEGRPIERSRQPQAIATDAKKPAEIIDFNNKTLDAAWSLLRKRPRWEWNKLEFKSQRIYTATIERILHMPLNGSRYGRGLISDLRRRHCKDILDAFAETAHMKRTALLCLRKLINVGLDEEWIEFDPTQNMKVVPETFGRKSWVEQHLAKFEAHWKPGSRQRVAYALALWLGNRPSDVALLRWDHLVEKSVMVDGRFRQVKGFEFQQFKGRKIKDGEKIFLPWTPMLERELAHLDREAAGGFVLPSGIAGRGYTPSRLTDEFSKWAREAGLPKGYTMHGLRKALGIKLVYADASTRQLMLTLGHKSIAYAELYSRDVEQIRATVTAMDKLEKYETALRRSKIRAVK